MKVIKEVVKIGIYKKRYFNVHVTESVTNYYCTAKQIGWALPDSINWKYSKKEYKSIDEAVNAHMNEIAERYYF